MVPKFESGTTSSVSIDYPYGFNQRKGFHCTAVDFRSSRNGNVGHGANLRLWTDALFLLARTHEWGSWVERKGLEGHQTNYRLVFLKPEK